MAWYLALQGAAHMAHQSSVYELQDWVDVEKIAEELVESATLDRVVTVPAVLAPNPRRRQKVTLYVRPAAGVTKTFSDIMSGAKDDRPGLPALLEYVREGRHRRGVTQCDVPSGAAAASAVGADGTDKSAHGSGRTRKTCTLAVIRVGQPGRLDADKADAGHDRTSALNRIARNRFG